MSDYYFMDIGPVDDKKMCKVRYRIPGLGFCSEKTVSEDTAHLLEIAKKSGRNELRKDLKRLMETEEQAANRISEKWRLEWIKSTCGPKQALDSAVREAIKWCREQDEQYYRAPIFRRF